MGSYKTIKKIGQTSLICGLTLAALVFGTKESNAQGNQEFNLNPTPIVQTTEKKPVIPLEELVFKKRKKERLMPKRNLIVDFANPISSFEANANASNSINQLFGKGNDLLGVKLGLDKYLLGRIGQTLFSTYTNMGTGYFSHEIAHHYKSLWNGHNVLSFTWDDTAFFGIPALEKNIYTWDLPIDDNIFQAVAGLNQNTFNSETQFRNDQEEITFDEGISFLINKLNKTRYITMGPITAPSDYFCGDLDYYFKFLNEKNIEITKGNFLNQSWLADGLSAYTLDSLKAILVYLVKGERSVKPTKVSLGGTELGLPLFSHYLTPEGGFYNIISFVNPNGKNPIEVNLGTDIDFMGGGKVDHLRFGGQYNNLKLGKGKHALLLSPFAYINTNKSFDGKGFSAGTKLELPITKKTKLGVKAEYNKDDMIENIVKGKDKGLYFMSTLNWRF